jgi:membrane fusion protein (multidrug efflux system)
VKRPVATAIKLLVFLGLAAFGGYRIWLAYQVSGDPTAKQKKKGFGGVKTVSVNVGRVETAAVREEILITGSLKPKEQVDITAKATGRIEKLTVQIGDFVKRGDMIAALEDAELQQQIKRAMAAQGVVQATMAQRRAELSRAEAELKRAEILLSDGLISRQDYDAQRTNLQVVQAQLELAKAQEQQTEADINELRIQLEQRIIYAPMGSFVAQRFVDQGALVSPATPIVRLVNLATMVTLASVPEREMGKLRVGAPAKVNVDALSDQTFSAQMSRISPVLDAATRSALVEVEIPNPDSRLKAEMFARVTLDLSTTRQALVVPREALVYRGQQAGVYIVEQKRPVFRPIDTGLMQGDKVEILTELRPGAEIVTRGATMLAEGDQIRVVGDGEVDAGGGDRKGRGGGKRQAEGDGRGRGPRTAAGDDPARGGQQAARRGE